MSVTEEDLREGYNGCSACGSKNVSIYYHDEVLPIKSLFFGSKGEPAYINVTCLSCQRKVQVRPGTIKATGSFTVETTSEAKR